MRFYFDFEFYPPSLTPISFAVVSESGRTFYAEFDISKLKIRSNFVADTVLPLLGVTENTHQVTVKNFNEQLSEFLGGDHYDAVFVCDYDLDEKLLNVLTGSQFTVNQFKPESVDEALFFEDEYSKGFDEVVKFRHHALHDAMSLKSAYEAVMQSRSASRG